MVRKLFTLALALSLNSDIAFSAVAAANREAVFVSSSRLQSALFTQQTLTVPLLEFLQPLAVKFLSPRAWQTHLTRFLADTEGSLNFDWLLGLDGSDSLLPFGAPLRRELERLEGEAQKQSVRKATAVRDRKTQLINERRLQLLKQAIVIAIDQHKDEDWKWIQGHIEKRLRPADLEFLGANLPKIGVWHSVAPNSLIFFKGRFFITSPQPSQQRFPEDGLWQLLATEDEMQQIRDRWVIEREQFNEPHAHKSVGLDDEEQQNLIEADTAERFVKKVAGDWRYDATGPNVTFRDFTIGRTRSGEGSGVELGSAGFIVVDRYGLKFDLSAYGFPARTIRQRGLPSLSFAFDQDHPMLYIIVGGLLETHFSDFKTGIQTTVDGGRWEIVTATTWKKNRVKLLGRSPVEEAPTALAEQAVFKDWREMLDWLVVTFSMDIKEFEEFRRALRSPSRKARISFLLQNPIGVGSGAVLSTIRVDTNHPDRVLRKIIRSLDSPHQETKNTWRIRQILTNKLGELQNPTAVSGLRRQIVNYLRAVLGIPVLYTALEQEFLMDYEIGDDRRFTKFYIREGFDPQESAKLENVIRYLLALNQTDTSWTPLIRRARSTLKAKLGQLRRRSTRILSIGIPLMVASTDASAQSGLAWLGTYLTHFLWIAPAVAILAASRWRASREPETKPSLDTFFHAAA